jgi:Zn-dependent peptidase ImmA (M78 family)
MSASARGELSLDECAPLCPWQYAAHRSVVVMTPDDLALDPADKHHLTIAEPESWSGFTIREGDAKAIVVNSGHSKSRQTSTLMHEMAHIDLKHIPNRVEVGPDGMLLLSDYSRAQEDEADWLAGALLLPRKALFRLRSRGASTDDIAREYGVSDQLCTWRLRMTGVDRQLGVGRVSPFG